MRDSLEKLIRGPPEEGEVRNSYDSRAEEESLEMENHRLRMVVMEMEAQQERLKSTVAMMRAEMETQILPVGAPFEMTMLLSRSANQRLAG